MASPLQRIYLGDCDDCGISVYQETWEEFPKTRCPVCGGKVSNKDQTKLTGRWKSKKKKKKKINWDTLKTEEED